MVDKEVIRKTFNNILSDKCSKPHISSLAYDLRTNDANKLNERKNSINERLEDVNKSIKENNKHFGLIYGALESIRKKATDYNNIMIDNIFKGMSGGGMFGANQQIIRDTEEKWKNDGYDEEYRKLMKTLPYVFQDVIVLDNFLMSFCKYFFNSGDKY